MTDDVSIMLSCRGGEAGGVAGRPPGEHTGICLLGMAAGVPRDEVFSEWSGGGVAERPGMGGNPATAAAMAAKSKPGDVKAGEGTQRGSVF